MKRHAILLIISIALLSCSTQKTVNNAATNFMKTPDLSKVTYEGGDGKSIENAVIIKNAGNEINGIASEYSFISKLHGEKFKDWKPLGQSTITKNDKKLDAINIELVASKEKVTYYFDITEFYGKF